MKKKIKNEKENDIQESCLSPEKKKEKKSTLLSIVRMT